MILKFFAQYVGDKFAPWVAWAILLAIVVIGTLTVKSCVSGDQRASKQAEQTINSDHATVESAKQAIDIIGKRKADDDTIDDAVRNATKGINDAKTISDVDAIVRNSLCENPDRRNDPACKLR